MVQRLCLGRAAGCVQGVVVVGRVEWFRNCYSSLNLEKQQLQWKPPLTMKVGRGTSVTPVRISGDVRKG